MPQNMSLIQKSGIALLVLVVFSAFGYAIQHTLSCLLLSFVLAHFFDPLVVIFEKKGFRRIYGILIIYTFPSISVLFSMSYLFSLLNIRRGLPVHEIPGYVQRCKVWRLI